jgi:acyl-CoA reductase-like NAD-dependent aldehyde dehydrogenase
MKFEEYALKEASNPAATKKILSNFKEILQLMNEIDEITYRNGWEGTTWDAKKEKISNFKEFIKYNIKNLSDYFGD